MDRPHTFDPPSTAARRLTLLESVCLAVWCVAFVAWIVGAAIVGATIVLVTWGVRW